MRNKVFLFLVAVLVVAGLILGCAAPAPAPTPAPAPAPTPAPAPAPAPAKPFQWPSMLVVMAGGTTAPGYVIALSWTPLHEQDTGATWRVVGAASSAERMQWLKDDKAQFYTTDMHTAGEEVSVGMGYETKVAGTMRYRIAWPCHTQSFGACTFADSGIKTIKNIKPGTTFSVPTAAVTVMHFYHAFRRYLNMTEQQLLMLSFASFEGAYRAFSQGQAKLVCTEPAGPSTIEWMSSPHGLTFLDWPEDKEAEARFREFLPDVPFAPVVMGPKEYLGIRMPALLWFAIAKAETDAEVIYRLVKWIDENNDRFKTRCIQCPFVTIQHLRNVADVATVPFHEGTIRYLREKGMWTAADDARQEYNVWLNDQYIKAYTTAMKLGEQKGIQILPTNKEWVEFWKNYKKEIGIPPVKIMTDAEVKAALAQIKK